jgi:hypothetical protein
VNRASHGVFPPFDIGGLRWNSASFPPRVIEADAKSLIAAGLRPGRPLNWPRPLGRIDAELVADSGWPSTLSLTCYVCGSTSFVEHVAGAPDCLGACSGSD